MEEKNDKKLNISTIVLILLLIVSICTVIIMYSNNLLLDKKISDLNNVINSMKNIEQENVAVENKIENSTVEENKKEYEDIVVSGYYGLKDSDSGWNFKKDGTVEGNGDVTSEKGTYTTTGKNTIDAHFTKLITYIEGEEDKNGEIDFEEKEEDIDKHESFYIDDDGTVYWINPDGNKEKLKRYSDPIEPEE